jgi:CheY-like chemotaxis protein
MLLSRSFTSSSCRRLGRHQGNARQLLERLSYGVYTAADGIQGMRLALDGDYDLLIRDLNLPGKDGLEVGRAMSQVTPRPYIYAYSSGAPRGPRTNQTCRV